jgi:hypothetical protein
MSFHNASGTFASIVVVNVIVPAAVISSLRLTVSVTLATE